MFFAKYDREYFSLFLRPCYDTLYSIMVLDESPNHFVLTGSPGIGKSLFIYFAIAKLFKERDSHSWKKIIFSRFIDDVMIPNYFIIDLVDCDNDTRGVSGPFHNYNREIMDAKQQDDNIWFKDSKEHGDSFTAFCRNILVASNRAGNYEEFLKLKNPLVYGMPTWDYLGIDPDTGVPLELLDFRRVCSPDIEMSDFAETYRLWGPVVRHLLQYVRQEDHGMAALIGLIEKQKLSSLIEAVGKSGLSEELSHKLMIFQVNPSTFQVGNVCLASKSIQELVMNSLMQKQEYDVQEYLSKFQFDNTQAALWGQVFEAFAHRLISNGGVFEAQEMFQDGSFGNLRQLKLEKRPIQHLLSHGNLADARPYIYYKPLSKNFATVDSLEFMPPKNQTLSILGDTIGSRTIKHWNIPRSRWYQFSRTPVHGLKLIGFRQIKDGLRTSIDYAYESLLIKVYMCVPDFIFEEVKWQKYLIEKPRKTKVTQLVESVGKGSPVLQLSPPLEKVSSESIKDENKNPPSVSRGGSSPLGEKASPPGEKGSAPGKKGSAAGKKSSPISLGEKSSGSLSPLHEQFEEHEVVSNKLEEPQEAINQNDPVVQNVRQFKLKIPIVYYMGK